MTTLTVQPTATVAIAGGTAMKIAEGRAGLDATRVPYAQASLTIPLLDWSVLDSIDQQLLSGADVRAQLTAGESVSGRARAMNLSVRGRTVDHAQKLITLTCASDEAITRAYRILARDTWAFGSQGSLRGIVNHVLGAVISGAALDATGADAAVPALTNSQNLVRNPRAATNLTDWSSSNTLGRNATGGPADCPSYAYLQSGGGSVLLNYADAGVPLQGGRTYRISVWLQADAGISIAFDGLVKDSAGNTLVDLSEAPAAASGAWERRTLTFTAPTTATKLQLRAFSTVAIPSGKYFNVTGWRVSETTDDPTDTAFYDGSTTSTTNYAYAWTGTAHASTSTRTALIDRAPQVLIWDTGESAWDYLATLCTSVGLVLFCDETRTWRLIDPATYVVGGLLTASGWNSSAGRDTISRDNPEALCTGVIVRYVWTDAQGSRQERLDVAGAPGIVYETTISRPYTSGIAAAILARRTGTGRVQDVTAIGDLTATPSQEVQITLPGTSDQIGRLRSVEWDLRTGLMDIGTAALIDAGPGTWAGTSPSLNWTDYPDIDWSAA